MYYSLVLFSAVLFAVQFICQEKYEKRCGTGLGAALTFSVYRGLAIVILMAVLSKCRLQITSFSLILSGGYALCYILMAYFSLKAFAVANLSVYSVFTMLGGMLLPFVAGVGFYNEEINAFKIICCLLIVVAVLLNIQKGQSNKKAFLYYMLVFVLNGMVGVIAKVHEESVFPHTDSLSFMFWSGVLMVAISGAWLLLSHNKMLRLKGAEIAYSGCYGFLGGLGDLFLLIAVAHIPASVQFPLVTGGVMLFSTLVCVIRREKLRMIEYFAAGIAFVSSVLMAF
jgi:drug/metabolite transporter (DMT)-like permease